jgi:hypothetical protein
MSTAPAVLRSRSIVRIVRGLLLPTPNEHLLSLQRAGCECSVVARQLLRHPDCRYVIDLAEFDLVSASGEDLGINYGFYLSELIRRGEERGLARVLPTDVATIRSEYVTQVRGTRIAVAMEPLLHNGVHYIFTRVRPEHGPSRIDTVVCGPDRFFRPTEQLLFLSPR